MYETGNATTADPWATTEVEVQDARENDVLPDGRYPFTVMSVALGRSKAGAPQAEMVLRVDGGSHGKSDVYEYIQPQNEKMRWKMSQLFGSLKGYSKTGEDGKVHAVTDWARLAAERGTVGGVCDVRTETEVWDGEERTRNRISRFLPDGTEATGPKEAAASRGDEHVKSAF